MELLSTTNLLALVLLLFIVPKIWEACWILVWRPLMLSRRFKKQGISGPKYKFLFGNLREMKKMKKKANLWVLDPKSNNIFPRVFPHYHQWMSQYVPVVRSSLRSTNLASNLKEIFARDTLLWPNVLEHYRICSPSCLRMGKANCQFPKYADEFGVEVTEPSDGVTQHEVSGLARGPVFRVPADVNVSARKRPAYKEPSIGSSSDVGRQENLFSENQDETDHSFSFTYDMKESAFPTSRSFCGDFARKVCASLSERPPVDELLGANLYKTWACKEMQSVAAGNALVDFYDSRTKAAEQEIVNVKVSLESMERTAQSRLRALNSEKGRVCNLESQNRDLKIEIAKLRDSQTTHAHNERNRVVDEIAGYRSRIDRLRRHVIDNDAVKTPLLMLSQVLGTFQCLQKLEKEGTIIPGAKMLQLEADEAKWRGRVNQYDIIDLLDGDLVALSEPTDGRTNV